MPRHRQNALGQAGFTLIEIVVVVAIIAILAAIVVQQVVGRVDDAQTQRARADIQTLGSALNIYKLDNYNYPSTQQGLDALVHKPGGQPEAKNWKTGGYIERLPKDPWGNDYHYQNPGQHGVFDVYTLGRDNQAGGEGVDADVGNWD